MVNGSSAVAALLPELSTPSEDKPSEAPAQAGIDITVGQATAAAVEILAAGLTEFFGGGGLDPRTKALAGEKIAAMFELQQKLGVAAFADVARTEGLKLLQARHGATFRAHGLDLNVTAPALIGEALAILDRVTKFELAMAH